MMTPVKIHGALGQAWRPMDSRAALQVLYQWRGLRRRPYKVFLRSKEVLLGVMGHPWGGSDDVSLVIW